MPNLFLGFPVPRSKIADMVASVDLYAGKGVYWHTFFESLDGLYSASSPAGGVTITSTKLTLATAGGPTNWASCLKDPSEWRATLSWAYGVKFKCHATFSSSPAAGGLIHLCAGAPGTGRHVGFKVVNGKLYGSVGNGSAETLSSALEDWGTGAYYQTKQLEVVFTPAGADFYVDGVKVATIATGLPTGTADARVLFRGYVQADGNANYLGLMISHYRVMKSTE